MSKRLTKAKKFEKIKRLARYHGEVVVVFKDNYDRLRKRKINARGDTFVSYWSEREQGWTDYSMSCFVCSMRSRTLGKAIRAMEEHDFRTIMPLEVSTKRKVIKL